MDSAKVNSPHILEGGLFFLKLSTEVKMKVDLYLHFLKFITEIIHKRCLNKL